MNYADLMGRGAPQYDQFGRGPAVFDQFGQFVTDGPSAAMAATGLPLGPPGYTLGNGVWDPQNGCFGPPVSPLLVQQVEPLRRVMPHCPTEIKSQWLGLPDKCIRKCSTEEFEITTPILFKFNNLMIDPTIAFQGSLVSLKVGIIDLVLGGKIPLSAFIPEACNLSKFDPRTIQPGVPTRIVIENYSNSDFCLRGALFGVGVY